MFRPLRDAFTTAEARGEIRSMHPDLLAGCFLWLMDGLSYGETRTGAPPRAAMAEEVISMMLDGLLPREAARASTVPTPWPPSAAATLVNQTRNGQLPSV